MYGETTLGRKSKTDKSIVTERKLRFRSNGEVLCGARFSNFPEEIGVDPKEFLEAFEAGVASANDETVPVVELESKTTVTPNKKTTKPVKEVEPEPEPEVEAEAKPELGVEEEEAHLATKLVEDITNAIEEADLTNADKKDLVKDFIALGVPKGNYKLVKDTYLLQEVLETVKEF